MQLFVTILHIILCLSLILIILLQPGKEGAAAFGGGGGNQMYGPRGQGHFLGRATTVVAGLFMFTSITLAWYSSERARSNSDIEEGIDELQQQETEGFDIAVPSPAPTPAPPLPELAPPAPEGSAIDALEQGSDAPAGDATAPSEAPAAEPAPAAPAPSTEGSATP